MSWSTRSGLPLLLSVLFAACSSDGTSPQPTPQPLKGLTRVAGNDTADAPSPGATPGSFHGTVLAPSEGATGSDTLATAPRIAGVRVTVYPRVPTASDSLALGDPVATMVTGSDGRFQSPQLAGGFYVVTFVPPAASPYDGVWASGYIDNRTHEWPWWVVLPRRP